MYRPHTRKTDLVDVAMGRAPADKIVSNGKLVNVYTREVYPADVAIKGDRIAAIGDVKRCQGPATEVIDAKGRYLVPGFVEPHLHAYHSYTNIPNFAKALLIHGTTANADGIYGPSIIAGVKVVKFMMQEYQRTPLKLIFSIPCVGYIQNRELGIDPAPNSITAEELLDMLDWPETRGLEEPPYIPVAEKDPVHMELYERAHVRRLPVTGHAAGVRIPDQMNAYAAAGTISDHEQIDALAAMEEARAGIKILMRQGSGAFDVKELARGITEYKLDPRAYTFCADLASPEKLVYEGDMDECVRVGIRAGIDPVTAIQMATLNAAEVYHLDHEIGSIAPGRIADILFVRDLRDVDIERVMANGQVVVEDGEAQFEVAPPKYPDYLYETVKLIRPIEADDFNLPAPPGKDSVKVRVIGVVDLSLTTEERGASLAVKDGVVQPDLSRDILRIAMVDRHGKDGAIGNGFVQGFGLTRGAVASTVNAVCENILMIGTNNEDMALAANHLAAIGGGKVVVADGQVIAEVRLPLLGLLSDDPLETLMTKFNQATAALKQLGSTVTHPFSTLEFCGACGEIGKIKIFTGGLIDAHEVKQVPVLVED